jgi:hypothetical protein
MKRLIAPLTLVVLVACAGPAIASGSTIQIAGIQGPPDTTAGTPGDPCAAVDPVTGLAPAGSNVMAGSLIGCWYTDTFNPTVTTPSGVIHATGAENFVGCLDAALTGACGTSDPSGSFAATYTFVGKFDAAGNEIWGRCRHKIESGTGGFAGATGRVNFQDNVANGTSDYRGHITLADGSGAAPTRAAVAAAASVVRPPKSMC